MQENLGISMEDGAEDVKEDAVEQGAGGEKSSKEQMVDRLWPQFRRLLVFQIKLYVDAFRDLFLSALSLGAFLIDLVQHNTGADSYFERVLKFGRGTERAINLFNHYDPDHQDSKSVDSVLNDLEDRFRK